MFLGGRSTSRFFCRLHAQERSAVQLVVHYYGSNKNKMNTAENISGGLNTKYWPQKSSGQLRPAVGHLLPHSGTGFTELGLVQF